ncbi:MAG: hypothetical protein EpisKO_41380 [Epibacterium sp.]
MNSERSNSLWVVAVRQLLRAGFGVEDIALKTGRDSEDVRREVNILRESRELARIYSRNES